MNTRPETRLQYGQNNYGGSISSDRWGDLEDAMGLVSGSNSDRWGPEGRPDAVVASRPSFIGHQTYIAPVESGQSEIFVSSYQGQQMAPAQTFMAGSVTDGWGGDLSIDQQPAVEPQNAPWRRRDGGLW